MEKKVPTLKTLLKQREELDKKIKEAKHKELEMRKNLKNDVAFALGGFLLTIVGKNWWCVNWSAVRDILLPVVSKIRGVEPCDATAIEAYQEVKKLKRRLNRDLDEHNENQVLDLVTLEKSSRKDKGDVNE